MSTMLVFERLPHLCHTENATLNIFLEAYNTLCTNLEII